MPKNRDQKRTVRSAKRKCKPGKWTTAQHAEAAIIRLQEEHPLHTLGMRPYKCSECSYYHVGRAGRMQ